MIDALRLAFGERRYAVAAFLLFPIVAIFYAWAAQVLIVDRHGLSMLVEPDVMAAIVILASLLAVSLPLQVYAFRIALVGVGETGGSVLGLLVGTASMSCCAPLLLPAVLSLIGFSGAAILSVNVAIHRFFVPLAALSAVLLGYSILSTASSVGRTCVVPPAKRTMGSE
ncbi:MAG TPA: hypothetical protein VKX16_05915 [Chloroflexota bacterium]|nr:hypothetical protein [Chloroflexota bacterium]